MNFITTVIAFVMSLFGKLQGWISAFLGFLQSVDQEFPGLIELIERLYDLGVELIDKLVSEGMPLEKAQAEAREMVVTKAKAETSASDRHVPEQAIRATLESVVYLKKVVKEKGTKYDTAEEMKNAQDLLRKGFGHGK